MKEIDNTQFVKPKDSKHIYKECIFEGELHELAKHIRLNIHHHYHDTKHYIRHQMQGWFCEQVAE